MDRIALTAEYLDEVGRRWQLSTLQVDLQEPHRFGIEYQAADG